MLSRNFLTRNFSSKICILGTYNNKKLDNGVYNAITASKQLSDPNITLVLSGSDAKDVANEASDIDGINNIIIDTNDKYNHFLNEPISNLLLDLQEKHKFTHIIGASNSIVKDILPRVGAKLNVQPITDIIEIKSDDTFARPIYAGNAIATMQSLDDVKILSVRTTAFDAEEAKQDNKATIEEYNNDTSNKTNIEWIKDDLTVSDRPELNAAGIVISGGRGVGSSDGFAILEELADKLHGAVGASRAAVDAGFCPNDMQVGQTGKVVAPSLYIAIGISGAIQHLAGMKDSKTIVAINKDPEAPIFQIADYGLVADLFKAVPELTEKN